MNDTKKIKQYEMYCTGCKLCQSVLGVPFYMDEKGFPTPKLKNEDIEFCSKICPASGSAFSETKTDKIWGSAEAVYLGWSTDLKLRKRASSGGILTSICCYLLETHKVDAVIHICMDDNTPWRTKVCISNSISDLIERCGSRYAISAPLENILQLLEKDMTYAFIGKPCDVSALRMYLNVENQLNVKIPYMFSFFCAGIPSEKANLKLLNHLGGMAPEHCKNLQYRGNGWPGFASAIDDSGKQYIMSYEDSWGRILGRDIRHTCRFCLDGIGEMADIACGDAWYLTQDMKPDFSENDGRNVVFARSVKGNLLLKELLHTGKIHLEDYNINDLKYIQKFQYERRATMISMIMALKIFGKRTPNYKISKLLDFARYVDIKTQIRRFLGTIKRLGEG